MLNGLSCDGPFCFMGFVGPTPLRTPPRRGLFNEVFESNYSPLRSSALSAVLLCINKRALIFALSVVNKRAVPLFHVKGHGHLCVVPGKNQGRMPILLRKIYGKLLHLLWK